MRKTGIVLLAFALVSCGKSPGDAAPGSAAAPTEAPAAAARDTCSLVADASATLGQTVTAGTNTMPNGTKVCEWKSGEGRICGSVTVFGPGFNDATDIQRNYLGMVTSLGAFGETKDVAGLGDAAKGVDAKMFGAQIAFRKGEHAALAASACSSGADGAPVLAEKLAREVAAKL
ncbi:MAG TPA: hypothetical protein VMF52_08560 [Steroidobacteraceae bacterium]|nr:hypothetical protein [Steroidobacteraceae bacterium]